MAVQLLDILNGTNGIPGFKSQVLNLFTLTNTKIHRAKEEIIAEIRKNKGSSGPDLGSLDRIKKEIITEITKEINKCSCTEKLKNELKPQLDQLNQKIDNVPNRIPRPSGDGGSNNQGSSWGGLLLPPIPSLAVTDYDRPAGADDKAIVPSWP